MTRNIRTIAIAIVAALAISLAGCGEDKKDSAKSQGPITVTSGGRTTTLKKPAERVVSLSPTATENLFAIDADKQVVAVDAMSNYPTKAPKTSLTGMSPNAEAILGFKPDLVVAMMDAGGLVSAMEKANVPVLLQPSATKLDDVSTQINDLGSLTGHIDDAKKEALRVKRDIDTAIARVPSSAYGASYYYEVDPTYYSLTSQTFVGDLLSKFKLQNIADAKGSGGNTYPQLSSEYIVSANPAYIFLADAKSASQSADTVKARPGWQGIAAVQNGHVIALDDDVASRWGPRVGELATTVANALVAK